MQQSIDRTPAVRLLLSARRKFVSATSTLVRALWHCLLLYLVLVYRNQIFFGYPLLAEGIIQAVASESNRRKMLARKKSVETKTCQFKMEAGRLDKAECIATVVGYREDSEIFRKCLESYAANFDKRHKAVCIGIDGKDAEDLHMREVAEDVFGSGLLKIDLDESFGHMARTKLETEMIHEKHLWSEKGDHTDSWMMNSLISKATDILQAHGALFCSSDDPRHLCITQPHQSKKEIMFTTFIFALALARANDVEFIWSSDSDSWVFPDTIAVAVDCIKADDKIAGSCTSLTIHNGHVSTVSTMVAATYEADLALTSGLLSSCDSTDCQSGPCATFRCDALKSILLPWYNQIVLGQRPIVNEDRHLTTRLLLTGAKVTYNPLATVATDTPTTIPKWSAQQVRWSRATAIESFCYPRMFMMRHPVLFIYSFRRLLVPIVNFAIVARYLLTGVGSQFSSLQDIGYRIILCGMYASFRHGSGLKTFFVHGASQVFLQVPQAAFLFWATVTMFENSWGTSMRSAGEQAKRSKKQFLGQHFWPLLVTTVWIAMVGSAFVRYVVTYWGLGDPVWGAVGGLIGGAGVFAGAIAVGM
ncbi:hypothetical protein CAC42_1941 [Sphaceloma murrayae]|uniref:Glycosyltransferase 2-like domain-containing protein n=1 Tax=Sphaceloma murrayae TaxID=2082308 RepID=A0A2K1QM06_9PEZI|nr:hypothetical protein CAC42_1941 [Sphaceloma murrayae]